MYISYILLDIILIIFKKSVLDGSFLYNENINS